MHKLLALPLLLLSMPLFGQDQSLASSQNTAFDKGAFGTVIEQVTNALKDYQANRGELPPLNKAEFDFKTTMKENEGGTFNIFIFKFGANHAKDITNDVTFTYTVPPVPPKRGIHSKPPQLEEQLAQIIRNAAEAT